MEHDVDLGYLKVDIRFFEELFLMGDDVQKISIINNLPQLIALDSAAAYNRIIPKIKQDLPTSSCEYQMAASSVFRILLQKSANTSILQSVLQGVDAKDPNVAFAWQEALFGSITNLTEQNIQNILLPLAKQKFQANSQAAAKVFCGRLVGEICGFARFRAIDVKKDILPMVTGLCQDVSADVRAQMCAFLPKVAIAIGPDAEKTTLLSSVVELAQDENVNVRATSIIALTPMLKILSAETSKTTLLPLIKKICTKGADESVIISLVLSDQFGQLMQGCQNLLKEDDILFFVKIYKQLSLKGKQATTVKANATKEVTIRQRCASNTYGIMKLVCNSAPTLVPEVYGMFREHAIDPCYLVRRAAATVLGDIAQLLGRDNKMMKNEIVRLLRDDAVEVLSVLVPLIATIFTSLAASETLNYNEANQATTELGKALIKCQTELSKGYNWRLTIEFISQLEILPSCFPADYIHNNFTPTIFDKVLNGKAKPVRQQAARTLVIFMRYNFKPNQTKWIRDSIIRQTALSKSCHNRILFFSVCESVLSIYSEKFFKEWFLAPLLTLALDSIANVRWKFMQFSTRLKSMVTLASDATAKQLLLDTIAKLESSEKVKTVLDMIKIKRREGPPKLSPDALKEEEKRVRAEATTNIKSVVTPLPQKAVMAATGDNKHVVIGGRHDMHFLEQHFYIDAGIKLEDVDFAKEKLCKEPTVTVVSDISTLYSHDLNKIQTTNITDDVKVNLRNIKSKQYNGNGDDKTDKSKRYSSIISENCLRLEQSTEKEQKILNRRSLNLCNLSKGKDVISKIPISNRSKFTLTTNLNIDISDKDESHNTRKKSSNLPVYNGSIKPLAASGRSSTSIRSTTSTHGQISSQRKR